MSYIKKRGSIFYGWYIVATFALTETISYGILYYSYSVYIVPLESAFGWTRAQITGAFSLALLAWALLTIPVGFWLDRYGARGLMTFGSIVGSLLFFAFSQVTTLVGLYAVWLGIGVCMAMVFYEPSFVVVAKWFVKRRGLALAYVTFIAGFASTIFLPLANWLLDSYGREQSIMILATILAVGTIPLHALVIRREPRDLGLLPDGADDTVESATTPKRSIDFRTALSNRTFWWLAGGFALASMSVYGVRVHVVPLFVDLGLTAQFAASAAGVIGAAQVLGRLLFAPVGDKVDSKHMMIVLFALQIVALAVLRFSPNLAGIWSFIILLGAVNGAITLIRPIIIADQYGTEQYGRISSVVALVQTLAIAIAPVGTGMLYATFDNNYNPVLVVGIVITALGIVAISQIRR